MRKVHIYDSSYIFQDFLTTLLQREKIIVKNFAYKYCLHSSTIYKMLKKVNDNYVSLGFNLKIVKKGVGTYVLENVIEE